MNTALLIGLIIFSVVWIIALTKLGHLLNELGDEDEAYAADARGEYEPTTYVDVLSGHVIEINTPIAGKPLRPWRDRCNPIVANLSLSPIECEIICEYFDQFYTDQNIWADIKLESFVEMIRNARSRNNVPVFFAQKRPLLEFAADAGLPWLAEMIRHPKTDPIADEMNRRQLNAGAAAAGFCP